MSRPAENASRSPRRAVRLTACLALAFAIMVGRTDADEPGGIADSPGRTASPSILDPVPMLDAAPTVGRLPATPVSLDRSLFVAVAVLAACAILVRVLARRDDRHLPSDVFAVLGEAPLTGTCRVRVVRFGPKTILVGMNGSACTTLAEIDDAAVTAGIVAECVGTARSVPPSCTPRAGFAGALWACLGLRAGGVS